VLKALVIIFEVELKSEVILPFQIAFNNLSFSRHFADQKHGPIGIFNDIFDLL
jgi:hypothetical protein